MTRKWN